MDLFPISLTSSSIILAFSLLLILVATFLLHRAHRLTVNLQRQTEQELHSSEQHFRNLIEGSLQGIFIQRNFKPIFVNQALVAMLGYDSIEEILGLDSIMVFFAPHEHERLRNYDDARARGEEVPVTYEVDVLRKDGKPLVFQQTVRLITWKQQAAVQVAVVDITELKRTEQLLKERNIALEASNRELQDFAYVASHDLQEPLRKIQAFGDRLASRYDDILDERGQDYLQRMRNAATRMQNLINDLLAFSRITTHQKPFSEVDLNKIVHEVINDLEATIEQSQAELQISELATLPADPLQMRQMLQNLISNALKYSKPKVKPLIKISGEFIDQGNSYCLQIKDNGIGFDNKYKDRIFAIFERLHSRTEKQGTGIGLAIVRKIVERHGGKISADGIPDDGATFTILLPTTQAQNMTIAEDVG